MPRVLNMYLYAPMFSAYLECLGVQPENLIYSEFTNQDMYRAGAGRGAIDPCFPSKVGIPHVYNLIFQKHQKKPLDAIFFPMIDTLHQPFKNCSGSNACPTVTATPNAVKAAFIKESDVFKENSIQYLDPILNIDDEKMFGLQMFETWGPILGRVGGRERARHRRRLSKLWRIATATCCSARARCWTRWNARTGWASSCWAASITTIRA